MNKSNVDNAWALHQAQLDWTGKADTKAAFAFGIDSAAIAAVVTLIAAGRVIHSFDSWILIVLFAISCVGFAAGIIFATAAVAPRLRARSARKAARGNYIYFGHLRHWDADALAREFSDEEMVRQLSRNAIVAADIAWKKHVAVNWSIWLTLIGGAALAAYVVVERLVK